MEFTLNTKPLVDGLELGIINSNVTKFYQKSCIVQLTIDTAGLRVNTEVSSIKSELLFKGKVSGEGAYQAFVDSLLFKSLIKSIDSDTVTLEFREDGLIVHSNKSKFTLPLVVSGDDLELNRPQILEDTSRSLDVESDQWKFIQDHQMYAIAMSFIHPVYTNVWISEDGDVIVGDFDNSIFTHSTSVSLFNTCLITDTIINLLTTVPPNSQILQIGKNYEIKVETDPYYYVCEFAPKYEDDEEIGDYSASMIMSLFNTSGAGIKVKVAPILKYLSQAELFSNTNEDTIDLSIKEDTFVLKNENVNCKMRVDNPYQPFELVFKIQLLRDAMSHMDADEIMIAPLDQEGTVIGIVAWTDSLSVVLAGVD